MANYISKIKNRKEVAQDTMEFSFNRFKDFQYKAGQHIVVKLLGPFETGSESNDRVFSFVSAPYEPDISIATRMRDTAFKRVIKTIPIGSEVSIEGPYGSFTLHKDISKPAVFLTGGIGITPFISMIRYAINRETRHQIFLFYSNRRPEDAAYLKELDIVAKKNPNFHLIATMTEMEKSKLQWSGKRGYIDGAMLQEYLTDVTKPIYYIAGPVTMVNAMHQILTNIGVNEDNIRTEEFSGY